MASRTKARELALQMLFQFDVGQLGVEHVVATFLAPRRLDTETEAFARGLFAGAVGSLESLDQLIQAHATNWRLDRMAAVDRNILRLALYELTQYPGTPAAVVINESLELARRFSQAGSVEFVNGVLDAVRKSIPPTQADSTGAAARGAFSAGGSHEGTGQEGECITIQLNGESKEVPPSQTVQELLEWLKLPLDRVAVERNLEILPRVHWLHTRVKDGDCLEVVHFVGGGLPADGPQPA